jgi:hypothetical protein
MKSIAAAMIGLGLLLAGSAMAAPPPRGVRFDGTYTAFAKGMAAGEFSYHYSQLAGAYQISALRRLTGFLRLLAGNRQDFSYSVNGAVANGQLRPANYQHSGGSRRRVVHATFTGDDIITTAAPAMGMGRPPATTAQRRGAVDQLTAIADLMISPGDPCSGTVRVYMDGRSRFDFVLTPAGLVHVDSSVFKGPALRCDVRFVPIAGFSDPQQTQQLTFVFARTQSGLYAPLQIEMPTNDAGLVRLVAQSIRVNGASLR